MIINDGSAITCLISGEFAPGNESLICHNKGAAAVFEITVKRDIERIAIYFISNVRLLLLIKQ